MLRKLFECLAALVLVTYGFVALLGTIDPAFGLTTSAASPQPRQPEPQAGMSAIPLVYCPQAKGVISASAFRVGPDLLVTVAHVARVHGCSIDGAPMQVQSSTAASDFALLRDSRPGASLAIDCRGFRRGRTYVALGHARGVTQIVPVELIALGISTPDGFALLVGIFTTVPGQSGGAIIDEETHAAVGIVNASDFENGISASMELKHTSLCARDNAITSKDLS